MATMWSNSGDIRHLKHFRVSIDTSGYDSTATNNYAGGVTPNGNFPDGVKYYYNNSLADDSSAARNSTRATTNNNALRRERGLMRWEQVVAMLQREANCEIFDIEILENNGDSQATSIEFTVGFEDASALDLTQTSLDGSSINNTVASRIKELVAIGINCGTSVAAQGGNTLSALRTVYLPATTDTQIQSVTVSNPIATGEVFDSITVTQIGTTKLTSTAND